GGDVVGVRRDVDDLAGQLACGGGRVRGLLRIGRLGGGRFLRAGGLLRAGLGARLGGGGSGGGRLLAGSVLRALGATGGEEQAGREDDRGKCSSHVEHASAERRPSAATRRRRDVVATQAFARTIAGVPVPWARVATVTPLRDGGSTWFYDALSWVPASCSAPRCSRCHPLPPNPPSRTRPGWSPLTRATSPRSRPARPRRSRPPRKRYARWAPRSSPTTRPWTPTSSRSPRSSAWTCRTSRRPSRRLRSPRCG